jgi:hypothetical protein
MMKMKSWLVGTAGAVALGLIGASAQAAPIGGLSDTRNVADRSSDVQNVVWVRRCSWHRGHRHCRRVWREYGYYPYGYYPYDYGYYDGPYAYGPSFGFFFGGGGHHHHHGHHGHHGHRR